MEILCWKTPAEVFTAQLQLLERRGVALPIESAQYTSIAFIDRPMEVGIDAAIGVTGSSYDIVPAETINGLYKTELIKPRGPWRTVEHVEIATLEWVDWFNHRRLYEHCGDVPPAELEAFHYGAHRTTRIAELLKSVSLRTRRDASISVKTPRPGARRRAFGTVAG